MTSRLPVRAMTTLARQLFLRGVFQGVRTFKLIRLRSFLSTGTKPLFVIKLNSRMAPRFGTRSIIRSKETRSEKLKSTLGLYNPKKSIEAFFNSLLSCPARQNGRQAKPNSQNTNTTRKFTLYRTVLTFYPECYFVALRFS